MDNFKNNNNTISSAFFQLASGILKFIEKTEKIVMEDEELNRQEKGDVK